MIATSSDSSSSLYILNEINEELPALSNGLYCDDGLAAYSTNTPMREVDKMRKQLTKIFKTHKLTITMNMT